MLGRTPVRQKPNLQIEIESFRSLEIEMSIDYSVL